VTVAVGAGAGVGVGLGVGVYSHLRGRGRLGVGAYTHEAVWSRLHLYLDRFWGCCEGIVSDRVLFVNEVDDYG
jgi:hypothetical protein